MKISNNAVYTTAEIPECMSIKDIQKVTLQDDPQAMGQYWTFKHGLAVIDVILMKS